MAFASGVGRSFGRVAEDGTHNGLLALGCRYAELWRTFVGDADETSGAYAVP
jgi:hypothetical protein